MLDRTCNVFSQQADRTLRDAQARWSFSTSLTPWTAANTWPRSFKQPGFGIIVCFSQADQKRILAKENENPPKQVKMSMPWDWWGNEDAYALGLQKLKTSMLWDKKTEDEYALGRTGANT